MDQCDVHGVSLSFGVACADCLHQGRIRLGVWDEYVQEELSKAEANSTGLLSPRKKSLTVATSGLHTKVS